MRILRDNGLTLFLLLLFAASIVGHALTGWRVETANALRHGQDGGTLMEYLGSAPLLSTVFENWESEFLQMAAYVVLTAFLIQRGSSESRDPEAPPRDADLETQAGRPGARARPHRRRWSMVKRPRRLSPISPTRSSGSSPSRTGRVNSCRRLSWWSCRSSCDSASPLNPSRSPPPTTRPEIRGAPSSGQTRAHLRRLRPRRYCRR